MTDSFHSPCESFDQKIHIVLVRPERGGNIGSLLRATANMAILGSVRIVGSRTVLNEDTVRFSKHAKNLIDKILFFDELSDALQVSKKGLTLAATARVGSAGRPHPQFVRTAIERAIHKLKAGEISDVLFVFGSEGSGLTNEELSLCDWVVTIPSSSGYRSLNLAHAVLIFCYEARMALISHMESQYWVHHPSQKERLLSHVLKLAEEVGFILPGDPFKMRPRLEDILSHLPNHIKDIKTLHGLVEQIRRQSKMGKIQFKGRFKKFDDAFKKESHGFRK